MRLRTSLASAPASPRPTPPRPALPRPSCSLTLATSRASALRDNPERCDRLWHFRHAAKLHRSARPLPLSPPAITHPNPVLRLHSSPCRALLPTAPGIGLVIGGAITYALSEGSFLPASCDGSRGREVRPEERDEEDAEVARLAGPTPSDGSDER